MKRFSSRSLFLLLSLESFSLFSCFSALLSVFMLPCFPISLFYFFFFFWLSLLFHSRPITFLFLLFLLFLLLFSLYCGLSLSLFNGPCPILSLLIFSLWFPGLPLSISHLLIFSLFLSLFLNVDIIFLSFHPAPNFPASPLMACDHSSLGLWITVMAVCITLTWSAVWGSPPFSIRFVSSQQPLQRKLSLRKH